MNRRGQTLVLFALTLLLLVLMVTMTLSIGMKAREKIELQTVADAAAYSNAVATARAFNGISLMNRALVGNMVAMSGVESLISWSSYYRAALHGVSEAYDKPLAHYAKIVATQCPSGGPQCACATQAVLDIEAAQKKFKEEDQKVQQEWDKLDRKAGEEALGMQIGSVHAEQNDLYSSLENNLLESKLAGSIAREANKGGRFGDELVALSNEALQGVVRQELAGGERCAGQGAACTTRGSKQHFVHATMGSRGYSFVTGRGGGAALIYDKLKPLMPERDTLDTVTNEGSGYFPPEGAQTHSKTVDATELWADDHGSIVLTFNRAAPPCEPFFIGRSSPKAHVRSTHLDDKNDAHQWTGGQDSQPPHEVHTMGYCKPEWCPGMWPFHMDYNDNNVADSGNNWGQPKLYSVIQRDYGRPEMHPDPWNLFFRFRLSPSSEFVTFDNRGIQLTNGEDISQATALSAGIAYYKRAGPYWREPPNFLNPFWRATLVSAQTDAQGARDMERVLRESAPFSAEVYKALHDKGYSAW
jgi:hypothetical protein